MRSRALENKASRGPLAAGHLLAYPAFEQAAGDFVFVVRGREVLFRPVDGELLTLDGTTSVRDGGVAPTLDAAWHQHLAEHEVVQPFPQ